MNSSVLWKPDSGRVHNSQLTRYMLWLKDQGLGEFNDYASLYQWSVENNQSFWASLWDYFEIQGDPGTTILEDPDRLPGAQWFPNGHLNFAENLLSRRDDSVALVEYSERGKGRRITYQTLHREVVALANHLKSLGIAPGDRVAGFVPNSHHAVVAMLASSAIGAVWSSCSPDFGFNGVLDRFSQIQPKILVALNGYQYAGKRIDSRERVTQIAEALPDLKQVIVFDYIEDMPFQDDLFTSWGSILESAAGDKDFQFKAMGFSDPLYILYSSGTTGKPKCIVHSVGGTLIQHLKELNLHTDVADGTTLFYYTTCGWMMWNWLVSGLALGARIVLFDGSPFHPDKNVLFDMAEQESVNVFGASAKYYSACEKYGLSPRQSHSLSALKTLLSTGSPLAHESFDYLYREVKKDLCVSSISGGTDIVSCFALGCPILPVQRGELQCVGLGMNVDFVDDQGAHLDQGKGELVCRQPFPSMPTGFWNDPGNERFRSAYFTRFEGIWAHGDYGEFCRHTLDSGETQIGVVIHGRSDAVLNPGGVRIGTAEIYRQVEKIPQVFESIAVGQDWQDDVRIVLFVRLQDGLSLDESLRDQIKQVIRQNTTPRHVPAKIIQIADIPKTLSGKMVELAVRDTIHGKPVQNIEALANPDALELYRNLPELQS